MKSNRTASAISRWARLPTSRCCALEKGKFGFADMYGARLDATERLTCELTLRDGKVLYDQNGLSRPDWRSLPADYRQTGDARWDGINPVPIRR